MRLNFICCLTLSIILSGCFLISPQQACAGGIYITDTDGNILNEKPDKAKEKTVTVGPSERAVVFNDSSNSKVFDVTWDPEEKSLVIKGSSVQIKVHSSGKIEKWTTISGEEKTQPTIEIKPIVPVPPKRQGK